MSMLTNTMKSSPFHEFKKQASFFLKEKLRTARLALTDVTPAELLTEEATNGNPWAPDARTMGLISRAAFEVDDYWRIVEILHKRLSRFDRKHWRESYQVLILLEHLLTHGPESVSTEFQSDRDVIQEIGNFQYIDEKGFNWGLSVRKKSEWVLKLLDMGQLLKEERDRARKLTREIQGFGSFCQRSTSTDASFGDSSYCLYGRSNSHYNDCTEEEGDKIESSSEFSLLTYEICTGNLDNQMENSNVGKVNTVSKENVNPESLVESSSKPLLGSEREQKIKIQQSPLEEDHPFTDLNHQSSVSLLSM